MTTTPEPKIAQASTEDWCERFPDEGHAWSYTHHAGEPRIETRRCYLCGYLSVQPVRDALTLGWLAPRRPMTRRQKLLYHATVGIAPGMVVGGGVLAAPAWWSWLGLVLLVPGAVGLGWLRYHAERSLKIANGAKS